MVSAVDNLRTRAALGRLADTQDPAVARQAATQLLSELFFKPLLAEMRRFPLGRDLATGGQTESVFGAQMDERLADTVARTSPGLAESMLRYFQPRRDQPEPARGGDT